MRYFILILISTQLYLINANLDPSALAIVIKNGQFKFAQPKWVTLSDKKTLVQKFHHPIAPWDKIFHFCPKQYPTQTRLLELKSTSRTGNTVHCNRIPLPEDHKVENPRDLKAEWDSSMEWYVRGYEFEGKEVEEKHFIPKLKFRLHKNTKPVLNYNMGESFVHGLSAFYDKNIKQIRAVQYELLPSIFYEDDQSNLIPPSYDKSVIIDLDNFNQFLEGTFLTIDVSITDNNIEKPENSQMTTVPMASPKHFITPLLKRLAWINMNIAPLWHKFSYQHKIIDDFLTQVSAKLGKLHITSGITGLGPINIVKRRFKTYHRKIYMPSHVWKVVEFKRKNDFFGIILVIDNSLSKTKEKICKRDVCDSYGWDIRDTDNPDSIYCCEMIKDSIKKLEVDFLQLEERLRFDLEYLGYYKGEKPS